jgi:hypothetical protein
LTLREAYSKVPNLQTSLSTNREISRAIQVLFVSRDQRFLNQTDGCFVRS